MGLDKDKLAEEMAALPLSRVSTTMAAAASSSAAATSASLSNSTTDYSVQTTASSTTNPGFLSMVITGAVNEVLSSKPSSSKPS